MIDVSQELALAHMQSGENVFLTGMAGTGKSHLVREYIGQAFSERVDLCATTGIAALNLQNGLREQCGRNIPAHTIHRWAGIGIGPAAGQTDADFFDMLRHGGGRSFLGGCARVRAARTLIIDEISMLPGRTLDYLDYHFRRVRETDAPFGGVQVIAVGDFLQLPPVSRTGVYDWAFRSRAWSDAGFRNCCLTTIHRQNDARFIGVLNDFREGRIRGETAKILQRRIARFPSDKIVRLMTHNVQVDKWNAIKLSDIDAEEYVFPAKTGGDPGEVEFLKKNLTTPETLRLKIGARVMVTVNIGNGERLAAANGETGTVIGLANGHHSFARLQMDDGREITIEPFTWQYDRERAGSGNFTQLPLRLAYAMTIHKSQGLTLESAIADIRAAREPGQAYVAISRVRNLSGLWLKDAISGVFISPESIVFWRKILKENEKWEQNLMLRA